MGRLAIHLIVGALLAFAAANSGNAAPGDRPKAGDGTTPETAVRIRSFNEQELNRTMARWLKANYPGFKVMDQMVIEEHGRTYNMVQIAGPNQTTARIYFDISMYARRANDPDPNPTGLPPRL